MPTDNGRPLYETGRQAMERGQLEEAIAAFRRSAQVDEHFETLELLGECLLKVGRAEEAIGPLESVAMRYEPKRWH